MRRKAFAALALAAVLVGVFSVTAMGRGDQARPGPFTVRMGGAPPNFTFAGVPTDVRAGTVRWTFRNTSRGQVQHNFTVLTLQGRRVFASRTLAAGRSQTLSRRMARGTYIAICTVNNGFHAAHRMVTAFQVQ